MTSTTSAGSGWKYTSLGTTVPTDSEKFTLVTGLAFNLLIDTLTRVRSLSFRLADTLMFDDRDCAVSVWLFDGGAPALVDGGAPGLLAALLFAAAVGDDCV
jgi:hypothetical protein